MRTAPKIVIATLVFALALGGALLMLNGSSGDDGGKAAAGERGSSTGDGSGSGGSAATSDVWSVGDAWVVKVRQDAGAITPDGESSIVELPYRFEVASGPAGDSQAWTVHVSQDGAQGPFANGWNLDYVEEDGVMVLSRVSVGKEPPLEAELATIVLGPQFPYEVRYEAPPKDKAVDAEKLLDRSELPPGELPAGGGTSGAAPPAEAPADGPGGVPAPPLD